MEFTARIGPARRDLTPEPVNRWRKSLPEIKGTEPMAPTTTTGLEAQKQYVQDKIKSGNFKFGLMVGAAFIRGIRDIGYKHTGSALAELVDNSFQSGAENIHIAFATNKSGAKVEALAVIDDGHGMIPDMIRFAVMWGGTHRENDRDGIGRYGYGLPSASVSQGKRFTVYSCIPGVKINAVTLDAEAISQGSSNYTDETGEIVIPPAQPAALPKFVQDHIKAEFPGKKLEHGTVVVIEELDKVSRNTVNALRNHLLEFFGVTYHRLLRNAQIVVHDTVLEPIDPLFITPGYRYYDLDADRAQALDPIKIEVKSEDGKEVKGVMEVRFAYMPPTFGSLDKTKSAADRKNQNARFQIMKEYNGILFYRMGRFLDCARYTPFHTFVNNDRYFKIEVDFPAVLDEYFNVSTSKQRVDVSDKIWDKLKEAGIVKAISTLTGKYRAEKKQMDVEGDRDEATKKRASEEAMEETAKAMRPPAPEIRERQQQRGEAHLHKVAEKRAAETGEPVRKIEEQLRLELQGKPYKVAHENVPGGAFFRVEQLGGTTVLFLNTAHRFHSQLYAGADSTPAVRAALEVLLFSIGDCIGSAPDQVRAMYDLEVPEWSKKLDYALMQLTRRVTHDDGEVGDAEIEAAEAA